MICRYLVRKLSFIKAEMTKFQAATSCAQREIDLIREFRTRLIADVVTGKIDVRHLAPEAMEAEAEALDEVLEDELPEEEGELEPDAGASGKEADQG